MWAQWISVIGVIAGLIMACAAGPQASAQEGPQRLALLANSLPVPLSCAAGVCVADLPAMCLEPKRPSPAKGLAYVPDAASKITVSGRGRDGARLTMALPPDVEITALRSHVAVRLRLNESWLRAHFTTLDGLTVAPQTVLLARLVLPEPRLLGMEGAAAALAIP